MNNEWIEAAKILGANPTAEVPCPECADGPLSVSDHFSPGSQTFERRLTCKKCGAGNVMRKTYSA